MNEQAFTTKDWLQRMDGKLDKLEEKIDDVQGALDRKADATDVRAVSDRVLVLEQASNQRLELWNRLDKRVERNSGLIEDMRQSKAESSDVSALWRVFAGVLSGSAIAILAWALTVFVR